jgi:N utilization substance protein A
MNKQLAFVLASRGIATRDDLAELAVDDLSEVPGLNKSKAAELIMAARAHWFV